MQRERGMRRGGKAEVQASGGRRGRRFFAILSLAAFFAAAGGSARGGAPLFQGVDWRPAGSGIEVDIRTEGAVRDYQAFVLQDPPRIVIDLPGFSSRFAGEQKVPVEGGWVRRIRHMGHPDKVRVVLDTEKSALAGYAVAPTPSGLKVAVPGGLGAPPAPPPAAGAKPAAAAVEMERPAWIAHPAAAEALARTAEALAAEEEGAFEIKRFEVSGNTVLPPRPSRTRSSPSPAGASAPRRWSGRGRPSKSSTTTGAIPRCS